MVRFLCMIQRGKIRYGGLPSLDSELKKEQWNHAQFVVLLDENTFEHCLPLLVARVEALQEASFIEVPVGEECKSLEVASQVWQTLIENGADRQTVVVNLGGGAVCDLGGWIAATYKRGIRHINVPTTLLAMVDAAIGGKTAIDFGGVKNSVGTFHNAVATIIDPVFLATLPPEHLLGGQMEMVKTAAVADPMLYADLIASPTLLPDHIKQVARIKAAVVKTDPYDLSVRKILNFGHTFGHAIEVYSHLPHGIAVGVGMKVAMYLSTRKTGLDEGVYNAYSMWINSVVKLPQYSLRDIEQMLPLMHHDKKSTSGGLRCVLLHALGEAMIDVDVSDHEVRDAMLHL